ncbi:trypsin-like peptidase domain-containing protein [Streptomyces sp. SID10815]|uniref:trypsin-like serine peptidase n=1 Tax=Streptomyces TaxID=1883 RepID=UPI0013C8F4BE|nr:trypsin-like peptidase domain-containing protein [Streptomyces sp. SID10815]NEA50505.1 trypsin-like serine protease [Streptomyces sp. SID10815]QKW28236.1 trypsin-like peptidase domain-containing protein [Streptomyces seoulensis]
MMRTSGNQSPARHGRSRRRARNQALFVAVAVIAVTSASVAAADDGSGPLGVTAVSATTPPSARVGALFAADKAGALSGNHFCTASVVHSAGRNLILTAAHCVSGDRDLVFVPGYRAGKAPYGVWSVRKRFVPGGWSRDQDEDSDLAFAVLDPLKGDDVEDVVGANRFVTGRRTGVTPVTVSGYPDEREVPVSCTNRPSAHSDTQQRIDCPKFTSGTSGSPWVNGRHETVGVLGGHEMGGSTPDTSYSVVFADEAAELYEVAAGAS